LAKQGISVQRGRIRILRSGRERRKKIREGKRTRDAYRKKKRGAFPNHFQVQNRKEGELNWEGV